VAIVSTSVQIDRTDRPRDGQNMAIDRATRNARPDRASAGRAEKSAISSLFFHPTARLAGSMKRVPGEAVTAMRFSDLTPCQIRGQT